MAQDTLLTGKINAPRSTYAPARHLYHSNGSLKFEPIVHLSTVQLIGCHVLTQRPPGHDSEAFFQQLSPKALYDHVFQQIDALRFCPQNIRYFLKRQQSVPYHRVVYRLNQLITLLNLPHRQSFLRLLQQLNVTFHDSF